MADNVVQFSTDQDEALRVIDDARELVRGGDVTAVVVVGVGRDATGFHSFFIPSGMEVVTLAGNLEVAKARVLAELDTDEETGTG